ncbi:Thymidylate synthase complementing protein [Thiovulum sp. ES]|nr:Thymidylate synthase complementing protein [Thiovulum sp. ES]
MKIELYQDGIGYVTDNTAYFKSGLEILSKYANKSELHRIHYVTSLASVSRGKVSSSNPEKRYENLLIEASPKIDSKNKSPSRPLEFLGVKLDEHVHYSLQKTWAEILGVSMSRDDFFNKVLRYSYIENSYLYTNMRTLLNSGIPYQVIPYNAEVDGLISLRVKAPMFVFNHIVTHTRISKEARSERVVDISKIDYWLPEDLLEKSEYSARSELVEYLLELSHIEVQNYLKSLKYPKEIYQRAMLEFRYKEFILSGYIQDMDSFYNLMLEREAYPEIHKSWVQKETRQLATSIRKLIQKD